MTFTPVYNGNQIIAMFIDPAHARSFGAALEKVAVDTELERAKAEPPRVGDEFDYVTALVKAARAAGLSLAKVEAIANARELAGKNTILGPKYYNREPSLKAMKAAATVCGLSLHEFVLLGTSRRRPV